VLADGGSRKHQQVTAVEAQVTDAEAPQLQGVFDVVLMKIIGIVSDETICAAIVSTADRNQFLLHSCSSRLRRRHLV